MTLKSRYEDFKRKFSSGKQAKWDASRKYIAVIGLTGSGLSQFIHDVTGAYSDGVAKDETMNPFTTEIRSVDCEDKIEGRLVTLIDTPGFDYSARKNEYVTLTNLAAWLKKTYGSEMKLDGVVYMHKIEDTSIDKRPKFTVTKDIEGLCRSPCCEKIILVNSHWGGHLSNGGEDYRERKLKVGYWQIMLQMSKKGSTMTRYESPGNQRRAREILKPLLQ